MLVPAWSGSGPSFAGMDEDAERRGVGGNSGWEGWRETALIFPAFS